ncbi:MAG: TIGR03984 family CRISPR-associated protein [Chloroflexi bacterium]|nr:TIGR03984 family CRISPR-associated protein [Chloroflexota bacterium]
MMDWKVKINRIDTAVTAVAITMPFDKWLETQGKPYKWLLAHTYDGVVWGRWADGWQLSSGLIDSSPELTADMLLELRLFGPDSELYVWRDGPDLRARTIVDSPGDEVAYYDEPQLLWGTVGKEVGNGFTKLKDGSQGLAHAVPLDSIDFKDENTRPVSLYLRHYVEKDAETGLARVTKSRLLKLHAEMKNGS